MHHSIELQDVSVHYGDTPALSSVSLNVAGGQFVSILGANGSGKTTLLKVINGFIEPSQGEVRVFGKEVRADLNKLRIDIGYVPQKSTPRVTVPITVFDVVLSGRYGKIGLFKRPDKEDRRKTLEALRWVGMEEFCERRITELSGGQQQKIFIARALVQEPKILLLDEPTSFLDVKTQTQVLKLIKDLQHRREITTLLVTHDLNEAFCSDFIYHLKDGAIQSCGTPAEVFGPELPATTCVPHLEVPE